MSGPKYSAFLVEVGLLLKAYTAEDLQIMTSFVYRAKYVINKCEKSIKSLLKIMNKDFIKGLKFESDTDLKNALEDIDKLLKSLKFLDLLKEYQKYQKEEAKTYESYLARQSEAELFSLKFNKIKEAINKLLKEKYNVNNFSPETVIKKEQDTTFDSEYHFIQLPNDFFLDEDNLEELVDVDTMLEELEKYNNIYHLSKKNKNIILEVYENIGNIGKMDITNKDKALRIKSEYENFKYLVQTIEKEEKEFNSLYQACSILVTKMNLDYKEIDNCHSLEEIKKIYEQLVEYFDKNYKDQYAADCIKEVMSDMGYNVLRSECLTQDNNQQYFKYDDEAAISVYRGNDGSCVMELVNTGYEDEMTDNEVKLHLDKMHKFCTKYQDILTKLEEKGIKIDKKAEMPVNKAFVKHVVTKKGYKNKTFEEKKYMESK